MSTPATDPTRGRSIGPILDLSGLLIALAAAVLKATLVVSTFPGWDFDPFLFPSPSPGIGPAGSMWCDAITVLGVAASLAGRCLAATPLGILPALLCSLGTLGVVLHAWPPRDHTIGNMWIGSAWSAAILLGTLIATTPRDARGSRARAIVSAVVVGFVALLAVRAAQQVFIEHPATVAEFRRNKAQVFAAQGWTPDSPMARAYERRILQPEATGWFGLANVLATFGTAGAVAATGLLVAALRTRRQSSPWILAGAACTLLAAAGTVVLAGGKGGYVATALGLAVLAILSLPAARRRPNLGGLLALAALAAPIALVLAGSRTEQLSLLFRWFYTQAALRIGIDNLPDGVGPDAFQAAYMLAKNPLSPEDVTSSHNVLLDWFATLGVFGLAWAILWCAWVWRAGVVAASPPAETTPPPSDSPPSDAPRIERWCVAGVGVAATIAATRIDQHAMTPDAALTRLAGLLAFVLAGWLTLAIMRLDTALVRRSFAAGAIAAASHALIDVTAVWPSAAAMLMVVVACGTAGAVATRRRPFLMLLPSAAITTLALASVATLPRVAFWEEVLRSTANRAAELGAISVRWGEIREALRLRRPGALDDARDIAHELAALTGAAPAAGAEEFDRALQREDERVTTFTAQLLEEKLLTSLPLEWRVRRETSRLWLRAAALREHANNTPGAQDALSRAVQVASAIPQGAENASSLAWLSMALEASAGRPENPEKLALAAAALEKAAERSPYELQYAVRLMNLWDRANDPARAARWAGRALELDQGMKYDREVKALSPEDRALAVRLSSGS